MEVLTSSRVVEVDCDSVVLDFDYHSEEAFSVLSL
jgi:hypothetical protein